MLEANGTRFNIDHHCWESTQVLSRVNEYTVEQRAGVVNLWADSNWMGTIPKELFVLFPSMHCLTVDNNGIQTLPVGICSWIKLRKLSLRNNRLQRLPSAMTRLTELKLLFLWGNTELPAAFQDNTVEYDSTQALLQAIGAHYGPIEAACRKTIVTLLGVRKFRPIAAFAFIGRDVMAIIGKMMWNDYGDGKWVRA